LQTAAPQDPTHMGALELARAIARGALRASAVVDAHIARIRHVNPSLNALVFERFDAARREAEEADRRARSGEALPPLHGVPITLKDSVDLAGAASTFGVDGLRAAVARDAAVVQRLREAGAIVLGKTNVAQLLLFLETDNPVFGRTQHPSDPERSCGGSSGGEAALIASFASPLGFGSDIGGSVRVPASFCGIVGFKPSAGRIVDYGRHSVPLGQHAVASQIGVLARSVEDAALGLRVALGSGDDRRGPLAPYEEVDTSKLRVAVLEDDGVFAPCPAARRAVREAAAALENQGARIVRAQLPERARANALFYAAMSADALSHGRRILGKSRVDARIQQLIDGATKPRAMVELLLRATRRKKTLAMVRTFSDGSAASYFDTALAIQDLRAEALAAATEVDIVLTPATALPALRHGASAEVGTMGTYTTYWNVLGWPAGVVPFTRVRAGEESERPESADPCDKAARATERGSQGLPIGVQVAARPHHDHVALAALKCLERRS